LISHFGEIGSAKIDRDRSKSGQHGDHRRTHEGDACAFFVQPSDGGSFHADRQGPYSMSGSVI
jgi:hypothetical protein